MTIPKSPAKIAAWSLAIIAATYFLGSAVSILRVVGTERVNRKTQIALDGPELKLKLTLPKGMWRISIVDSVETITANFELAGEDCKASSSDSSGIIFHTDKDFTNVEVKCRFDGDVSGQFREIRAVF